MSDIDKMADEIVSKTNIISYDGYYELNRDVVAEILVRQRNAILDQAAQAARTAQLPDDYIWSESNREKFAFGAERAAAAVAALAAEQTVAPTVETERPRTIYDHRIAIQASVERAGPHLYAALKNLLDAVEERQGLRESVESVVLSDAHTALANALPPPPEPRS